MTRLLFLLRPRVSLVRDGGKVGFWDRGTSHRGWMEDPRPLLGFVFRFPRETMGIHPPSHLPSPPPVAGLDLPTPPWVVQLSHVDPMDPFIRWVEPDRWSGFESTPPLLSPHPFGCEISPPSPPPRTPAPSIRCGSLPFRWQRHWLSFHADRHTLLRATRGTNTTSWRSSQPAWSHPHPTWREDARRRSHMERSRSHRGTHPTPPPSPRRRTPKPSTTKGTLPHPSQAAKMR